MHNAANAFHVVSGRLAPEGLFGLLSNRARVFGVISAATSAGSTRKPFCERTGTGTTFAPQAPNTPS
ncbi:hypothetical protein D3C71_705290 [compost metagenome]